MERLSLAALGLALLVLAGCSSAPKQAPTKQAGPEVGAVVAQHALEMRGKPYRYGGSSPRGFDCSGLVQYSYARVNMRLPRSTEGLWSSSRAVSRSDIRPGDLLFFHQEGKRNSHVAIYVGSNRFVHAPSSGKQVSTASLSDRYWSRHFSAARRPEL
jgi:cell wall-associated NlpC family hydrolase